MPSLRAKNGYLWRSFALLQEVRRQNYEAQQRARLVFKIADIGLLSPELEKLGILGPTDKSRRLEMSLKNWSLRRGLAIDVAVVHPVALLIFTRKNLVSHKIDRYAPAFKNSDYDFAVVFETSGAVNKEGETVLKQIIRFASKREGITHTVYAARAWARLLLVVFNMLPLSRFRTATMWISHKSQTF